MAMNFVDVASYQASLNLFNINYDGVAIKATEGNAYVNPYCDMHFQEAKQQGKKRAVYHFYDFNVDPITQADYFVDNCIGYIRDAVFVLDWEGAGVDQVQNAQAFLNRVEARTGYKPAIYMSEWVENNYNWSAVVANDNGLWIAKYSNWELQNHAHDWDMSNAGTTPNTVYWPFYFMWQWTSTGLLSGYAANLDCDIAYLDAAAWDKYAGVQPPAPAPEPTTTTTTTVEPTTTSTTTEASQETTTTTGASQSTTSTTTNPVPPFTTSTTQVEPSHTTTTTEATAPQRATWLQIVVAVIIAFIKRLQGKVK